LIGGPERRQRALSATIAGLDAAAIHFTKNPHVHVPAFKPLCFHARDKGEEYPKG
jgi:hypothetical protein